jgi:hypothetical protein
MGKHAGVVENRFPYIYQQLFAHYTNYVFLPFLRKVRMNLLLVSQLTLWLTDNCKAYMEDEVQKILPIMA